MTTSLEQVPPEILFRLVVEELDAKSVAQLAQTSRYFYTFCSDPDIWTQKAKRDLHQVSCPSLARYLELKKTALYPGCEKIRDPGICLWQAAEEDNLSLIQYLLEESSACFISSQIKNAVESAAYIGHLRIVEYLLEHLDGDYLTEGLYAATEGNEVLIMKYILQRMMTRRTSQGIVNLMNEALCRACMEGRLEATRYLVETGISGIKATNLNSALWYAARKNHSIIVDYLSEHGATNRDEARFWFSKAKDNHYLLSRGPTINIISPSWNIEVIPQIQARVVRHSSHQELPDN